MANFTNQATLTYNNLVTVSNTVSGTLNLALSGSKAAVDDYYFIGDTIPYIIHLTNTDDQPVTVNITDDLGKGTSANAPLTFTGNWKYFVNGTVQTTGLPIVTAAGVSPLVVTGLVIPANSSVSFAYEAIVNQYASPVADATITNTAVFNGGTFTASFIETATITSRPQAVLSINKAISTTELSSGDTVTYTFTIQNAGNVEVQTTDGVILQDNFVPFLSDVSVQFKASPSSAWTPWTPSVGGTGGDYDYSVSLNESGVQTGYFTTHNNVITVPAATYTPNPDGSYTVTPGQSFLEISGKV